MSSEVLWICPKIHFSFRLLVRDNNSSTNRTMICESDWIWMASTDWTSNSLLFNFNSSITSLNFVRMSWMLLSNFEIMLTWDALDMFGTPGTIEWGVLWKALSFPLAACRVSGWLLF